MTTGEGGGPGISVVPENRVVVSVTTAGVSEVGPPVTGVAAVIVMTWADEPGKPGRVTVNTVGEAGAGVAVRVTEERAEPNDELVADVGGGSAEATTVDVDSAEPTIGAAAVIVMIWADEPAISGRVTVNTVGEAGVGAAVRVTEEGGAPNGKLVADAGGGSAEATTVDVDSANPEVEVAEVPVVVPTVRVKLAVTIWWLELDVGAVSITV